MARKPGKSFGNEKISRSSSRTGSCRILTVSNYAAWSVPYGVPQYTYSILLTSLRGKQNYLQGLDAEADDFMSKPLDPDLMEAQLRVA